ncbi:MAG TPA: hypothetical protein PKE00_16495, partial [Planctomycetota bacterium]|nr:hypothetical protein [Planctomycetota bacterium]
MNLAPFLPLISVICLVLAGLASLTLSLSVWRRRRAAMRGVHGGLRLVGHAVIGTAVLGLFVVLVAFAIRSFFPRSGSVSTADALVVRADPQRGVPRLVEADRVDAGAALVVFERAIDALRRKVLLERSAVLEAQIEALHLSSLDFAAEHLRRKQ